MSQPPEPIPQQQAAIVSYVQAGGFPPVAAEAAGVSRAVFAVWMREGEGPKAQDPFRPFAEAVRQAAARARLMAELTALRSHPLDWLKSGPGKETAGAPGWTTAVPGRPVDSPAESAVEQMTRQMLEVLEAHPEARAALARWLAAADEGGTGRPGAAPP